MPQLSDEEIAQKIQAGDSESFGILVTRFERKIRRYGKKFLSNTQDLEDIVQNIFIKAYTNIQSFNAAMKFSPWLYRIAHNEFVNALRKNSHSPLSIFDFDSLFPHLTAKETADSDTNNKEIKYQLDKYLKEINPKYREVLLFYYFEEMSYAEIAEILRIPVSTVGVRLIRGKNILKNTFEKYDRRIK
ncbi:MAG: hypothetical protein A2174_00910 [Candidatus Portnoybacteria bacterium RBG_13_41_18]|uniref:RNA polymerase sigma factor n=1 Tax=Candidatus Portnoybacteria bacterium RBG_13_41_18 TaxID=1801991 RepID=A0A1G2F8N8_9BACT|nr:MAG: hypothetical protein A2174_00910 [Candidatus Portnoybacteria bacterium RBG_13_41_18]